MTSIKTKISKKKIYPLLIASLIGLSACAQNPRATSEQNAFQEISTEGMHEALVAKPLDDACCAEVEEYPKRVEVSLVLEDSLLFDSGSFFLSENTIKKLDKLATDLALSNNLNVEVVELSGYADSVESENLSRLRINSIQKYLSKSVDRKLHWQSKVSGAGEYEGANRIPNAEHEKHRSVQLTVRATFSVPKVARVE